MKRKSLLIIVLITSVIASITLSCKTDVKKEKTSEIDSEALSDSLLKTDEDLVFYSFPSSQEMFSFIKRDAEMVYRTDLVNPPQNISRYINTTSRTLALGVYLADLSYMTLFNKTSSAYDYIDIIQQLSNDLRINLPFQDDILKRLKNNLTNQDSLIKISDQYSSKIIDYLLKNNKEQVLATVTAASYIEGLYIALNLVGEYSDNNQVIRRIVEQKYSFTNLIKYAEKHKADKSTKIASDFLEEIFVIFEQFEEFEKEKSTIERTGNNHMVLKGGNEIIISEKEFYDLKEKVTEVRTKIVESNL